MLHIKNLSIDFFSNNKTTTAVDNVSFTLNQGENIAIVGESGSGKSAIALSILGLLNNAQIHGSITYYDITLNTLTESELQSIRGNDIAIIHHNSAKGLNPAFSIGSQILESITSHNTFDNPKIAALNILQKAGLTDVENLYHKYPHQFSTSMRQKIMIAMAFSCEPSIVIVDEATKKLDITSQSQILQLIKKLNKDNNSSLILISSDLGSIKNYVNRVVVMYHGKIVEDCPTSALSRNSIKHPYTKALLDASEKMIAINGATPLAHETFEGCPFSSRCPYSTTQCSQQKPNFTQLTSNHSYSCFHPIGGKE